MPTDLETWHAMHKRIHAVDPKDVGSGYVQWKGTDVCMDINCSCGFNAHHDGEFFYFFECPKCKKVIAVGDHVTMVPLTDDEAAYIRNGGHSLQVLENAHLTDDTPDGGGQEAIAVRPDISVIARALSDAAATLRLKFNGDQVHAQQIQHLEKLAAVVKPRR